ncbi:hypothetical protein ACOSP7_020200 [Xanthoceras sorbifolium]|uniref:SKP1-like protein n=1 Tax=Xanthoceras sorbifolium TaxID=99658 RepID=A0ABQ8HM51_9ROSI|nr:hypothetical protein JRO89_XS09G0206500 [Xanthoceras sorbifolium]
MSISSSFTSTEVNNGVNTTVSVVLKLRASDGQLFEAKQTLAGQSEVLKLMVEDGCTEGDIPLNNVTGRILAKHEEKDVDGEEYDEQEPKEWERDFFDAVHLDDLHRLLIAANYLNIKALINCGCQEVAVLIKGKSVEEIRETFNIKSDLSPEEEEAIRRENA